jgi:hypothetical protein
MLNRRYALLGWAVWRIGKAMAKRRAKAMVPSSGRSISLAAVVPAVAAAAVAAWFVFFRRRGADHEAELLG